MRPSHIVALIVGAAVIVLGVMISVPGFLSVRDVQARCRTMARMDIIGAALHQRAAAAGGFPTRATNTDLQRLISREDRDRIVKDAWGFDIRYQGTDCGTTACKGFRLVSPGSDGAYEREVFSTYVPENTLGIQRDMVLAENGWIQLIAGTRPVL